MPVPVSSVPVIWNLGAGGGSEQERMFRCVEDLEHPANQVVMPVEIRCPAAEKSPGGIGPAVGWQRRKPLQQIVNEQAPPEPAGVAVAER